MFELMANRAAGVLETTRLLGRQIYRLIRKEQRTHYTELIEKYLAAEHEGEGAGQVTQVETNMVAAVKSLQKGDEVDVKLEQKLTLFIFRYVTMMKDDSHLFDQVLKNPNLQDALGDDHRAKQDLQFITEELKKEQNIIHEELLRFARITRDQHDNQVRLRDEILINVMGEMRDRQKARRLRRLFAKEDRISSDDKKTLKHLRNILKHADNSHPVDAGAVKAAIHHIAHDLRKEDSILKTLMASIEFILKTAIRLYFKLMDEEGKIKSASQHLKEMKFPEQHAITWQDSLAKIDAWLAESTIKQQHMMYQLLHQDG